LFRFHLSDSSRPTWQFKQTRLLCQTDRSRNHQINVEPLFVCLLQSMHLMSGITRWAAHRALISGVCATGAARRSRDQQRRVEGQQVRFLVCAKSFFCHQVHRPIFYAQLPKPVLFTRSPILLKLQHKVSLALAVDGHTIPIASHEELDRLVTGLTVMLPKRGMLRRPALGKLCPVIAKVSALLQHAWR